MLFRYVYYLPSRGNYLIGYDLGEVNVWGGPYVVEKDFNGPMSDCDIGHRYKLWR